MRLLEAYFRTRGVDYEQLYRRERKTTQLLRRNISDLEEKLKASECTCKKESTCCTT